MQLAHVGIYRLDRSNTNILFQISYELFTIPKLQHVVFIIEKH